MVAKKIKRASSKMTARKNVSTKKRAMGVAKLTGFRKAAAKELTEGPLEKSGESIVDAARRLWLSAQSLVTSLGTTSGKSRGKRNASR
jgi:hypothetical protein